MYERLITGRGEFLAELRPAVPVFVRFTGIDYDDDDEAIEKLDDFIRRTQAVLEEHGGHLLQITLGDKGAYLYAVFGSPQAHEDDAARAAAAALEILALDGVTAARELQIGIAKGRLRSGTYGHAMRRTFVCLGDAVNLAARLMSHAWPGQVITTAEVQGEAGDVFTWEQMDDVTVKGKEEPVSAFALTGRSRTAGARQVRYELPIVGRQEELEALDAALWRAEEAQGSVVGISAEAGVGKSRLVAEFVRKAREQGVVVAFGESTSFGTSASYGVWQEIWRALLRIGDGQLEAEQRQTVERELAAIDPALVPRAPLLEPVLGITIPDNELTGSLEAEVRKSSLEALLADCLRARATEESVVLVLEDCHWMDPLSRDLLQVLARAAVSLRVLVVVAYRPAADGEPGGGLGVSELAHFSELALAPLAPEEAEELIRARVAAAAKTDAGTHALVEHGELPIVGREEELAALDAALWRAEEAQGSVVGISAEAGVGKSRLVAEFVRKAREQGVVVAFGESTSFGTSASSGVWQEIWRALLRIGDGQLEAEQRQTVERELAAIDPALVPRAPLLEPVLGITIPDNELTGSLEAEVRKASLEALLADCLRARATEESVVLVLEDCHWMDPLSRDLLQVLARAAVSLRVLVVVAYRPAADGEPGGGLGVSELAHFSELALAPLAPEEAEELIRARVAAAAAKTDAGTHALVELVTARAEGNPFYIEELLNYIGGQQIDVGDASALAAIELPDSLHSLVLSRVDTLSEAPRRTIKVASVVGRSFDVGTLVRVYPELGSEAEIGGQLRRLRTLDLVTPDRGDDSYLFKHAVTHEVTYESMPFSFRAMLHERVGADLEATAPDAIDLNLDLLAHHYWLSENAPKKREYLVRAGESAKANYANEAAIDYLERAAPLLEPADRWRVTREVGEVREVVGDWAAAESTYRDTLALAEETGDASAVAWTHTSLADLYRRRGELDEASRWVESARERFEALEDKVGLGRVLQLSGTIAAMHGDFVRGAAPARGEPRDQARARGRRGRRGSALEPRRDGGVRRGLRALARAARGGAGAEGRGRRQGRDRDLALESRKRAPASRPDGRGARATGGEPGAAARDRRSVEDRSR